MTRKSVWFIVFLLIGIFLFLKYVMPYVLPFALGAFLAFLLDPLVSFLTKRTRITRGWAAFISILLMAVGLSLILSWGITRLAQEIADLYGYFPCLLYTSRCV